MTARADIVVASAPIAHVLRTGMCLTAHDHARAARIPAHAWAGFVAARSLLRREVSRMLDRDPRQLELADADGCDKPRLVGADGLDFHLAHGGAWVVVAIARGCRVGVDVQPHATLRAAGCIAEALELAVDREPFARQRVRCEARSRAIGSALPIAHAARGAAACAVVDLDLAPDHAAALAHDVPATIRMERPGRERTR